MLRVWQQFPSITSTGIIVTVFLENMAPKNNGTKQNNSTGTNGHTTEENETGK